jgi:MFS family permease
MKMKLKILLFFLHEFFGSLDFARGLFVLFLASRGMSMGAVGVLQTLLFWSNILFEIPAGLLADKFKRKTSIALGLFAIAAAAFMIPFATSFAAFAAVFVLHGMGFAFRSGADKALLFDELKAAGPEWADRFLKLSGTSRSLVNIGLVLAMAAGGFMQAAWGWTAVYFCFGAAMLVAAFCVLAIDEGSHAHNEELDSKLPFSGIVSAVKDFFKTREGRLLGFFIFGMGFLEATHAPFFIYIQSYLKDGGLAESKVSLIIALSMALTSVGYLFVDRMAKIAFPKLVAITCLLLIALISAFLWHPPVAVGILFFAVIDMLPALLFVHSDTFINEKLPSEIRASLLSVHSLVSSVFISFTFLGAGRMLDFMPASTVLGALAILPLAGLFALGLYFKLAHPERIRKELAQS